MSIRRGHTRPRISRTAAAVLLIALVALSARVAYVAATPTYPARAGADPQTYDYLAGLIAAGKGYARAPYRRQLAAYRPPGYPYFLGALYRMARTTGARPRQTFARYVQALVSTLTVLLTGLLARRLWGPRAGIAALAIAAVYLPLITVGGAMLSEATFVPLLLGAVLCALELRRRGGGWRWSVAAGALIGLTALTRENGLLLIPLVALIAWPGRDAGRHGLVTPAAVVLAAVLTVAPWTVRNLVVTGEIIPVSVETGPTLAGTYNDASSRQRWLWRPLHLNPQPEYQAIFRARATIPQGEFDRRMLGAVLGYLYHRPTALPAATFWNTVRMTDLQSLTQARLSARETGATAPVADASVLTFWAVGLLALAGVVAGVRRSPVRTVWLVPLVLLASTVTVTSGTPRQRAGLDPFVICLAALAASTGAARVARHRNVARALIRRAPRDRIPV